MTMVATQAASTHTTVVPALRRDHDPRQWFEAGQPLVLRTSRPPRRMGPVSAPRHAGARHGLSGTTAVDGADTRLKQRSTHGLVLAARTPEACDQFVPLERQRAQGMPGEGLTHGPPAKKMQAAGTTGKADSTGIPCATGFTLIRSLPGAPGLLATIATMRLRALRVIPASGYQDAATSRPRAAVRPRIRKCAAASSRPSLPASRVVTIARNAPPQ